MEDRAAKPADPQGDPGLEVNSALSELLPQMRGVTGGGWAIVAALFAFAVILLMIVRPENDNQFQFVIFTVFICGILIFATAAWTRRRHEALVMPVLARSAGLGYRQNAKYYVDSLPERMMLRGTVRKCEDLIEGKVAGRRIAFGEVKIETGGKNSSILFKGVVVQFPNIVEMPPFFIAAEKETKGWFIFKGRLRVDDLSYIRTISGRLDSYGVWSREYRVADEPGFEALLEAIFKVEAVLDHGARVYSASSDGRVTHVAIRQSRDLFRLGGLFANSANLEGQIRRAHHDLLMPIKVVQVLLGAEARTLTESREKASGVQGQPVS